MPPQGSQHRYLCDVLLLVQTFAPTHIEVRYASLAGAALHLAREHRGGCHRILSHTNRPRRRGRNPGPRLEVQRSPSMQNRRVPKFAAANRCNRLLLPPSTSQCSPQTHCPPKLVSSAKAGGSIMVAFLRKHVHSHVRRNLHRAWMQWSIRLYEGITTFIHSVLWFTGLLFLSG